jgi:glutamine kinase
MKFDTKSQTLAKLFGKITCGEVLPQLCFKVSDLENKTFLDNFFNSEAPWINYELPLIVRSSSCKEDSLEQSFAGHFESVLNVLGKDDLIKAVNKVAKSLEGGSNEDQIFIQPMLTDVDISGVAFTRDPNNSGYYYVINYDDSGSGSTSSVTDGSSNDINTYYHFKTLEFSQFEWINSLIKLLRELEYLFSFDSLDVEFALKGNILYLLQVRPLILKKQNSQTLASQESELMSIEKHILSLSKPHPYLYGDKSIFGVMPDWNPAEIIGIRPKPLALSLYKELITDGVWAYQRDNYGYKNLRSFPLLYSFSGFPYIDIRISFNSFIPKDLNEELSHRLVNYYINYLSENQSYHDKIEFDVVFSCYTLDLPKKVMGLENYGFSKDDCNQIINSLRDLTNSIIQDSNGLWKQDISKIEELKSRHEKVKTSSLSNIEKVFWFIEDCKRYGTLPFAGLARAGFIAIEILKSLVNIDLINTEEYQVFLSGVKTVSSDMTSDLRKLSKKNFIKKYGHLRPGTYEITSSRYDDDFNSFFGSSVDQKNKIEFEKFSLRQDSKTKLNKLLKDHGIKHNSMTLLSFIKNAIEAREYAKFIFSRSLSDTLNLVSDIGNEIGLNKTDLSFVNIQDIMKSYSSTRNLNSVLHDNVKEGKSAYDVTSGLQLPTLIINPKDVWSFSQLKNEPSFVTLLSASGHVVDVNDSKFDLRNSILMIPSADPGYDWIFSQGIIGFITMYGGVNSHMAIRASELGIPAVIGSGESLYNRWLSASKLEINCANKKVIILR